MNIQKELLKNMVTEYWNRVPREFKFCVPEYGYKVYTEITAKDF